MGKIPFVHRRSGGQSADLPGAGRCRDRHRHGARTGTSDLDNPPTRNSSPRSTQKYNRDPATFAALGYDAIKAIDGAVRDVNGKIEDKDAVRAAMRKAHFHSVRGKFKFNNNHFPIQDIFMMEVKKNDKGQPISVLKDTAIKDSQDHYHTQCPMK